MLRQEIGKLSFISVIFLLAACDTIPDEPQRQLTPLEACINEAKRDSAICGLGALGSVKSGVPDSYYQCEARRVTQEDRCNARYNPNFVPKATPRVQQNQVQPQRRTTYPSNVTLIKQWIGRNAERFCQYSDGSIRNVGYDLCE